MAGADASCDAGGAGDLVVRRFTGSPRKEGFTRVYA
jgi:hypothetical protein